MKKLESILSWLALSIVFGFTLSATAAETSPAPKIHLPDPPDEGLPLAQCFDYNMKDKSVYAGRYYFVWGAKSPEQPSPIVACSYLPIGRDYATDLKRNLKWWKANHPDWIVYQADRATPAWGFTYSNKECVPLDYSNPDVREWYFENLVMPLVKAGWKMIGFDNCDSACLNWDKRSGRYDRNGNWIQMYTDDKRKGNDPRTANDLVDWLKYLSTRLHSSGVGIAANIAVMQLNRNPDATRRAVEAVDLLCDEGGFTWHRNANITDEQWKSKVAFLRQVLPHKLYMCSNQTCISSLAAASHEQVAYAIGSFLIVREKGSMLCLNGVNEYGVYLDRPELNVKIGSPVEPPTPLSSGVWQRKYTGGLVLVNPSSKKAGAVDLPSGVWQDFGAGKELKGKIELPPDRAMVLLHKVEEK